MKKYLLSGVVVMAFFVYVGYQSLHTTNTSATNSATTIASTSNSTYKNGTYTGTAADAYYGNIQVQATISAGKITDVAFLQYPQDRGESVQVNSRAMPQLKSEAIQTQSSNVDIVSGATDSSLAFKQSLASALVQAQS